jgi:Holliday junction resolvasome RuvABC endonuclease subunit/integrase
VQVAPWKRGGRGRIPNWIPDEESRALLELYARLRLGAKRTPAQTTVRTECSYLRALVSASISFGGPDTLVGLRDDPHAVIKIITEWPRPNSTLRACLRMVLRLIDLTVDDRDRAKSITTTILDGLEPRARRGYRWDILPLRVGGSRSLQRVRPVLSQVDLLRIVEAAGTLSDIPAYNRRNQLIMALEAWSGLSAREMKSLRFERIQLWELAKGAPWCAFVDGIVRRGRRLSIPIAEDASPYLASLYKAASEAGEQPHGYVFTSLRGDRSPLTYQMIRMIVRRSVRKAGIPECDELTFKRAYSAYLKQRGVADYAIRDAMGRRAMRVVDRLLLPYRWATAQRVAAEHHVVEAPPRSSAALHAFQLRLGLDKGTGPSELEHVRVMGVDPAYWRTGWAILDRASDGKPFLAASGTFVPPPGKRAQGLLNVERQLHDVLQQHKPAAVYVEKPGRWVHRSGTSRETVELMAMARGSIIKVCEELGIPAFQIDFQRVRLALLGRGNAGKADAADLIRSHGLMPPNLPRGDIDFDVVDAIMMALYGLRFS